MTATTIEHDYGLGSAYERYCFYQLLDRVARSYGVASFLEGPVDGMSGVAGVHGVGLARRGVRVTSLVESEAQAEATRAVYRSAGAEADVRVSARGALASLAPHDMVLSYHAVSSVEDFRAYLVSLASAAKRVFFVTVRNPHNWTVQAQRALGRLLPGKGFEPPREWYGEELRPVLERVGTLREHVYFDCPWWPDLQLAPGQGVRGRVRALFRLDVHADYAAERASDAEKHVYGAGRWPYFGGGGWHDELLPALLLHPGFDGAPQRIRSVAAHLHGFVVDTRDRAGALRSRGA